MAKVKKMCFLNAAAEELNFTCSIQSSSVWSLKWENQSIRKGRDYWKTIGMGGIGKRLIRSEKLSNPPIPVVFRINSSPISDLLNSHLHPPPTSPNLLCVCELMNAEARLFIRELKEECRSRTQSVVWRKGLGSWPVNSVDLTFG